MTGIKALGILILKKKPIRMRIWPQGERIVRVDSAARTITQMGGNGLVTTHSVNSFPWEDDDWEFYEQREICTFAELFDKLKPGDEAWYESMGKKTRYCVIGGVLKVLTQDNYCILPQITKELLDAKFVIRRSGVA